MSGNDILEEPGVLLTICQTLPSEGRAEARGGEDLSCKEASGRGLLTEYPTLCNASATVVSLVCKPPFADAVRTPSPRPTRTGRRPVIMEARLGVHTWKPLYQCWKVVPSAAILARCGVLIAPSTPV